MVVVDAHSKWVKALIVSSATSQTTIEKLRHLFATHGLPEVLVSDNGTTFTSAEFATFTEANGITHLRSAPYHPSSNGLAIPSILKWVGRGKGGPDAQDNHQKIGQWCALGNSDLLLSVPISPDPTLHNRCVHPRSC